jgi:ADP-heptose:LPS heptosyltransferase
MSATRGDRDGRPGTSREVRSIAVIRALALGDMLCAVPALRALRRVYPEARISLVGLSWSRELVGRFGAYLDEHLEFPGFPGIPEVVGEPGRIVRFLAEMQARRFDLAIQLQGDGVAMNAFAALFGARHVAGFVPPGLPALADPASGTWLEYPSRGSEVDRLLALAAALGAPRHIDRRLEFPICEDDLAALDATLAGRLTPDAPFAVIHAGGSTPGRRWLPARFAAVADPLARQGLRIVLTGTQDESAVAATVARAMGAEPLDLTGRTVLGALAALLARARVVVSNDTGVAHLAAAVGAPSVTVFSASDRDRWAPVGGDHNVAVGSGTGDDVPVALVVAAVRDLLDRTLEAQPPSSSRITPSLGRSVTPPVTASPSRSSAVDSRISPVPGDDRATSAPAPPRSSATARRRPGTERS